MNEADQITREAVARLRRTPATREAELRLIWSRVVDAIHTHMEKRRNVKVFEVHHMVDVARSAFFAAWMRGEPDDALEMHALERVKLWTNQVTAPILPPPMDTAPTLPRPAPVLPRPAPVLPRPAPVLPRPD